jgi:hypothetical protein
MPSGVYHVPGPVQVYFGSSYTFLGGTKSGVVIRARTTYRPVTDDAHGEEPATYIFSGKSCAVDVVGLDAAKLKTAFASIDIWPLYWRGLTDSAQVGALAHDIGKPLRLVERVATNIWEAGLAVLLDPDPMALRTTEELQLPVTFLIVPDENDKLFKTLPSYIVP